MCNAKTSKGTQCRSLIGLVDGLCARHRKIRDEPEKKCNMIMVRGNRKGEECGARVKEDGKCSKHLHSKFTFMVMSLEENIFKEIVGPFESLTNCISSAKEYFGNEEYKKTDVTTGCIEELSSETYHIIITKMTAPKPEKDKKEVKNHKCEYIFRRGVMEGHACGQRAGESKLCGKHSKSAVKITCSYVFIRGKNIGSQCTRNARPNSEFCGQHGGDGAEVEEEEQCKHIFTKGDREGQKCTNPRTTKNGSEYCSKHRRGEEKKEQKGEKEEEDKCEYMFTRGANKGEQCTKKKTEDSNFCSKHHAREKKATKEPEKPEPEEEKELKEDDMELETCEHVFTRGAKQGQRCSRNKAENSNMCNKHTIAAAESEEKPAAKILEEQVEEPVKPAEEPVKPAEEPVKPIEEPVKPVKSAPKRRPRFNKE